MSSEKTEILTFEDVLSRESYVICDSALTSVVNLEWYWDGVYRARNFAGINSEYVKKEREYLESFLDLLTNPKVLVSEGVSLELQRARNMIGDKIKYLREMGKLEKKKRKYHRGETQTELLSEVHALFHESFKEARRTSFSPGQKSEYGVLEKIVLSVTKHTNAKIDLDEFYEHRAKPKNTEDFHTDEQIVAVALYLSVIENGEGCILTKDSDIKRILKNTLSYLALSNAKDSNEFFSLTKTNGIRIYFVSDFKRAESVFDSRSFDPLTIRKRFSEEVIDKINQETR